MSRHIPMAARRALAGQPCAICGATDDLEWDHITPVSRGGTSASENIQNLCRVDNAIKGAHRTNAETIAWINANAEEYARRRQRREFRFHRRYL